MDRKGIACSFECLKKFDNRNQIAAIEGMAFHFYFEALLSTLNLRIVLSVDEVTVITESVRAEVHGLKIIYG